MMPAILARASVEGALAVVLVAAVSFLLARRAPALRCRMWWVACCKLLVGLAGVAPLSLPILPAAVRSIAVSAHPATSPAPASPLTDAASASQWPWPAFLFGLWAAGVLVACLVVLRRYLHTRWVLGRALPNADPETSRLVARLSRAVGLGTIPKVAMSPDVGTPQVAGIFTPTILLPSLQVRPLSSAELAMALCHELVHIRRRDLGWGWVPAIAARVFFFHPGAILAAHEYSLAREEACDAEVLRVLGVSPARYGRLLVAMNGAPRPALAPAAGVSSSFLHLRRRLRMLGTATDRSNHKPAVWAVLILLGTAILIPVRLSARTPQAQKAGTTSREDAYVIFLDQNSVTMSGSLDDLALARRLRDREGEQLLWFRRAGTEYVVKDPSVLRLVVAARGDVDERAAEARQAQLNAEQMELEARLESLSEKNDALADASERKARAERYAAQADRERQRAQMAKEIDGVSTRIERLGAEQDAIAREIERVAMEADRRIRELLEESVRSGAARHAAPERGVEGGIEGGIEVEVDHDIDHDVDDDVDEEIDHGAVDL